MWRVALERTCCVAVHPSTDHIALGVVSGLVHVYSSKEWALCTTFRVDSDEGVAPVKMFYVSMKDDKATSWLLLVCLHIV